MKPVKNPEGPEEGVIRVLRGGGLYNAKDCRVAHRGIGIKGYLGFRIVLIPKRKKP